MASERIPSEGMSAVVTAPHRMTAKGMAASKGVTAAEAAAVAPAETTTVTAPASTVAATAAATVPQSTGQSRQAHQQ